MPFQEQDLAKELVKRLVLAWDPDFTKLTPENLLNEADNNNHKRKDASDKQRTN